MTTDPHLLLAVPHLSLAGMNLVGHLDFVASAPQEPVSAAPTETASGTLTGPACAVLTEPVEFAIVASVGQACSADLVQKVEIEKLLVLRFSALIVSGQLQ